MEKAHVISVNPGVKTLGELNAPKFRLADISRSLTAPGVRNTAGRDFTAFLLAAGQCTRANGRRLLCARVLGMVAFAATAMSGYFTVGVESMAFILPAVITVSLAFGLLVRPLACAGAIVSLWGLASDFDPSALSQADIMTALACGVFAIMGAGRYSADYIMFRFSCRMMRRKVRRAAKGDSSLAFTDYRAYGVVDRRVRKVF